ncbi:MAG: hypothetical protein WCW02_01160 [Candidatus Buchananbacteria bacterium]
MTKNFFVQAFSYVFVELIGEVLFFPVWWYSTGVKQAWTQCLRNTDEANDIIGLSIWLNNLFKPMFAQYDWQGRLISFFMRVVQIIFRAFAFFIWFIFIWSWLIIWLVLPIFIVYQIGLSLGLSWPTIDELFWNIIKLYG